MGSQSLDRNQTHSLAFVVVRRAPPCRFQADRQLPLRRPSRTSEVRIHPPNQSRPRRDDFEHLPSCLFFCGLSEPASTGFCPEPPSAQHVCISAHVTQRPLALDRSGPSAARLTARGGTLTPFRSGTHDECTPSWDLPPEVLPTGTQSHPKPGPFSGPAAQRVSARATCSVLARPSPVCLAARWERTSIDANDRFLPSTMRSRAPLSLVACRHLSGDCAPPFLDRGCTRERETGEPGVSHARPTSAGPPGLVWCCWNHTAGAGPSL